MPINWEYLPDQKLLLSFWDGKVGLWEWNIYAQGISAPEYEQATCGLAHLATARLEFTLEDTLSIISYYVSHPSHRKMALVAGENLGFGMEFAQMLSQHAPINMKVFHSLLPACAWIRVDDGLVVQRLRSLRDGLA